MEQLQAAVYFDHVGTSAAIMWRHENPVSFYVEKDGETRYWDGGHCEIVGEGTYVAEDEGEADELGMVTESSTLPQTEYEADEDEIQKALALSVEDPQVDEELARRLSDLDSIPHVPRVNAEIPPLEASSSAKERLSERLRFHGLAERQMAGDGNCQFRALSDQLYRSPDHHTLVRKIVVSQLTQEQDSYSGYVPMEYSQYLENMARDGEWGDHVTLQAAADFYGTKISLITSFKDTCFIEIIPAQQKSQRGIYLSFWSEIHYNSIYPVEESTNPTKKKKQWFS